MSTLISYQMSRFNDYSTFMEESIDYWYQELPYHKLREIYSKDNVTDDLQRSWYKLSYHEKNKIYEDRVHKDA